MLDFGNHLIHEDRIPNGVVCEGRGGENRGGQDEPDLGHGRDIGGKRIDQGAVIIDEIRTVLPVDLLGVVGSQFDADDVRFEGENSSDAVLSGDGAFPIRLIALFQERGCGNAKVPESVLISDQTGKPCCAVHIGEICLRITGGETVTDAGPFDTRGNLGPQCHRCEQASRSNVEKQTRHLLPPAFLSPSFEEDDFTSTGFTM